MLYIFDMKIEIVEVNDQPDGSAIVTIDIDEEYKQMFISSQNLEKWSDEFFQKYFIDILSKDLSK